MARGEGEAELKMGRWKDTMGGNDVEGMDTGGKQSLKVVVNAGEGEPEGGDKGGGRVYGGHLIPSFSSSVSYRHHSYAFLLQDLMLASLIMHRTFGFVLPLAHVASGFGPNRLSSLPAPSGNCLWALAIHTNTSSIRRT